MFTDANPAQFKKIFVALGFTDLRKGIDGLSAIVNYRFGQDPYEPGTLFLFCGRKNDRVKGLLREPSGFLLLTMRLDEKRFRWPGTKDDLMEITPQQFICLVQGLEISGIRADGL